MIDENKKCKEYCLYDPEILVKYVADRLNLPFSKRNGVYGISYSAQFIPCPECDIYAFASTPVTHKFYFVYPDCTVACDDMTVKEVIDKIIESIEEHRQHEKQKHIDAIVSAAATFEA